MAPDEWKRNIVETARKISDRAYQEESWFHGGDRISSPEELYCGIFDDFLLDAFLLDNNVGLSDPQRAAGRALKEALERYSATMGDAADPRDIIDAPGWEQVRRMAGVFVRTMETS